MCFSDFYSFHNQILVNAAAESPDLHRLRALFHAVFLKRASQADIDTIMAEIPKSPVLA